VSALGLGLAAATAVLVLVPRSPRARRPGLAMARARWSTTDAQAAIERLRHQVQPRRARARRDAQLPEALDALATALRAGLAVPAALTEVAASAPDPLGTELRAVAGAAQHGIPLRDSLARWAEGPDASDDVAAVVAALTISSGAGGQVARAVDRIAAALRERRALQGEVRALATQARASAGVLAVAPLAFVGLVATIDPGVLAFLLTTPVGLACLVLGIGLEALGASWMRRIVADAA